MSKLRTMMKEKLISEKELRKLMKATVRSEKEKKVTFKISEFSRNNGKDLMKVLFSKRTPNEKNSTNKRQGKRDNSRSSSESSCESEIKEKESKKRRGHIKEEDMVEPSREPKKALRKNEEKNRYKSFRETKREEKVKRNTAKTSANLSEVAISHEGKNGVDDKFGKEKKPRSESRDNLILYREDDVKEKRSNTLGKRRHSAERRSEKKHYEEEEWESKKGERSCNSKKDGMLEVKVVNKKPVFDEGVVDDEKIGRKLMKKLLEKEGKRDMSQRLGPMPSGAIKRAW